MNLACLVTLGGKVSGMKLTAVGGAGLIGLQVVQNLTAADTRPSLRHCPPASTCSQGYRAQVL
ncbi:hypothetical protein GCM10023317_07340 [Actinopolymorpha pittospori]